MSSNKKEISYLFREIDKSFLKVSKLYKKANMLQEGLKYEILTLHELQFILYGKLKKEKNVK
jgi:hypothetical protein